MPISKSDVLFSLIKSLTRGEKRHFRSFAQRESDGKGLLYLKLFDILEKQTNLDEKQLATTFAKAQLPNLKRHLYSQVLTSIRLQERKENSAIQLREYLDFANILYGKGLYLQSLKLIEKAKTLAKKLHDELILLQLLEFEKIIESRHITRTGSERVNLLTDETSELIAKIQNRLLNSNLRLLLHGYYIKHGHVKSTDSAIHLQQEYKEQIETIDTESLGLIEKAYFFQSKVWYHFILLDFETCLENAIQWLELFKIEGKYIHRDTNLMMRAYHYILTCLYHLEDKHRYTEYLEEFESFRKDNYKKFNKNSQIISFIYVHNGRLNKYMLTKKYNEGISKIPSTINRLKRYGTKLDTHRVLVLHYKIALLYIMANKPEKAIKYLHGIMNNTFNNLREDLQGYVRITFLMAHYDMENYDVIEQSINSVNRYFKRTATNDSTPVLILDFFKNVVKVPVSQKKKLLKKLKDELLDLKTNKYKKRGLLYLHIVEWIDKQS